MSERPDYMEDVEKAEELEKKRLEEYKNPERLRELGLITELPYIVKPLSGIVWPTADGNGNGCWRVYGVLILGLDKDTLEVKCFKHIVAECTTKRRLRRLKPFDLYLDVKILDELVEDCSCGYPYNWKCNKAIESYLYGMLNLARKTLVTMLSLNPSLLAEIVNKSYDKAQQRLAEACQDIVKDKETPLYKTCIESGPLLYYLLTKNRVNLGGCNGG